VGGCIAVFCEEPFLIFCSGGSGTAVFCEELFVILWSGGKVQLYFVRNRL